jgi:hypothetical protein
LRQEAPVGAPAVDDAVTVGAAADPFVADDRQSEIVVADGDRRGPAHHRRQFAALLISLWVVEGLRQESFDFVI